MRYRQKFLIPKDDPTRLEKERDMLVLLVAGQARSTLPGLEDADEIHFVLRKVRVNPAEVRYCCETQVYKN